MCGGEAQGERGHQQNTNGEDGARLPGGAVPRCSDRLRRPGPPRRAYERARAAPRRPAPRGFAGLGGGVAGFWEWRQPKMRVCISGAGRRRRDNDAGDSPPAKTSRQDARLPHRAPPRGARRLIGTCKLGFLAGAGGKTVSSLSRRTRESGSAACKRRFRYILPRRVERRGSMSRAEHITAKTRTASPTTR